MDNATRTVLFLTGTRADFGKMKPLIHAVNRTAGLSSRLFVTGMHLMARYGRTVKEIEREGFSQIHRFTNQIEGEPMDLVLSNTIAGLARFVHQDPPELMVVHGDRIEALAGATVGALRGILTAHIEGGEHSGTVDGLIRHSITKLAHAHFVANEDAASLLRQLGEHEASIFPIGSPDIDVMLSNKLPSLEQSKAHYEIGFEDYAILLYHPVTSEVKHARPHAKALVDAVLQSDQNYIVVNPNNDHGSAEIFAQYERLRGDRFRVFPSTRFEHFLTLLKHSKFILGNSSSGIREAPVYGIPAINVGTRQAGRFKSDSIIDVEPDAKAIMRAIICATNMPRPEPLMHFGDGKSAQRFAQALLDPSFWNLPLQKTMIDNSKGQRAA